MKMGSLRCTHCHRIEECDTFPNVLRIYRCPYCGGDNLVMAQYLEYNGDITFKVGRLPKEFALEYEKFLRENR